MISRTPIPIPAPTLIGEGSFGTVYKVYLGGKPYALKQIDFQEESKSKNTALNELGIMVHLNHWAILKYEACSIQQDTLSILTEYIAGSTLKAKIRNSEYGLPRNEVLKYVTQLCFGLTYLHNRNIVHRDIKSENILITTYGDAKIADFGISGWLTDNQLAKTTIGTPLYTAPEIFRSQPYNYAVDMWSLGVVVYEMCHNSMPFQSNSIHQLRRLVGTGDGIFRLNPLLDNDIKEIIEMLLVWDPKYRAKPADILALPVIKNYLEDVCFKNPPFQFRQ